MRIQPRSSNRGKSPGWLSLVALLVIGLTALALLSSGPGVWATERQSRLYQTVPTNTPTATATPDWTATPTPTATPDWTPTPTPTATLGPTSTPTPTLKPGEPTHTSTPTTRPVQATSTPTPTVVPAQPTSTPTLVPQPTVPPAVGTPLLTLNQSAQPDMVLPGTELVFTLQLTNPGADELRNVRIEDVLSTLLILEDVGAYLGDVEIANDRAVITLDRLAPGLTSFITIRTRVAWDVGPGMIIDHQPVATYGGVVQPWPLLSVPLPPAELPPTGGDSLDP